MFELLFIQAARDELVDAEDWYESEQPGLAQRFLLDIVLRSFGDSRRSNHHFFCRRLFCLSPKLC